MFGFGRDEKNVVSMMTRENERRMAPLREVESYWHSLCGVDTIPVRSQIDPRGIEGALEYAFLAERIAPGMAKIRVAGSHLSDLMGMEVSGMPMSSLFAPEAREALARDVTRLFAEPAILRAQLRAEDGFGKPEISGQLLLMPLRSDMGDVSRAIGCLITRGRIGRVPRRFLLDHIEVTPVFENDVAAPAPEVTPTRPTEDYLKPRTPRAGQFDEPAAPFTTERRSPKRPDLRIVVSNDI
ncbi:PAS domain-containing protein [Puniceibacterium sediminis]|uniref:PAS domain-containing protein n=1 Tax=Puniceibacterium sediminis TaxID=1608407 RepID=A0A238X1R2_9RHOB|nr:PAS domain-containing protein [Puniceibacterium sediminis]SNR52493.1 hypothetical protein SAMN06265370_108164 [Puniceibacterium sediminis]